MKTKLLMLLAAVSLLAGCAYPTGGFFSYRDDFSGDTTDLMTDNYLATDDAAGPALWLNASRIAKRNGVRNYYLEVYCEYDTDRLDIEPGQSLILIIDGQNEHAFSGLGSGHARKKAKSGKLTEHAIYSVTSLDIQWIANAKDVKVRVIGTNGTLERNFQPVNIEQFKEFVDKYVEQ